MKKSKLAFITLSIFGSVALGSCKGPTTEEFMEKLFPNVWDALAVFLAFVVLLIAVFYFAYKPVKKLLKQRGDYVEDKIKTASLYCSSFRSSLAMLTRADAYLEATSSINYCPLNHQ